MTGVSPPEAWMFAAAIIQRELRVRSRRPVTSWLRMGVGVVAAFLAIANLNWMSGVFGAAAAGKQMFLVLAWMAFAFSILEGARCASDVISWEKREGTLGFLILTNLSGFEVVLGKFAAVSVTSFYALLALFPAMAIALPAGGLTAGEFWRTQAALLDTLFLAVAAGLWVSARSEDAARALLGSVGLLSGLVLLPALIALLPVARGWPSPSPAVLMSSADASSYALAPGEFWGSWLVVQGLAWALLILAGRRVTASWQPAAGESRRSSDQASVPVGYTIPASLHSQHGSSSRALLEEHPVRWFVQHRAQSRPLIWLAVLMYPLLWLAYHLLLFRMGLPGASPGMIMAAFFCTALLGQLILAVVASRQLAGERASETLEVLLATPLTSRQIVLGHWWGLWQLLRRPLWIALFVPSGLYLLIEILRGTPPVSPIIRIYQMISPMTHLTNVLAVCWLAMWLSVRIQSRARVIGLTLLFNVLVPYLLHAALGLMLSFLRAASPGPGGLSWPLMINLLIPLSTGLIYSVVLILWARHQLLTKLRAS